MKSADCLAELRKLNSHIAIYSYDDKEFLKYGKVLDGYDFNSMIRYMEENTKLPEAGNTYVPSDKNMENMEVSNALKNEIYGAMPIQAGYCNGRNSSLNGFEYHKGSEINVAVTDMVLLLGLVQDIKDNEYDSKKAQAFFVPKGAAVEMYQTTLHFAPCKTSSEGFKAVVVLPEGTNTHLGAKPVTVTQENKLLFMKNKWLLVHESRTALIEKGAHIGIKGENIEVKF